MVRVFTPKRRLASKCPYKRNDYVELLDCDLKLRIGRKLGDTVAGVVFDGFEISKGFWILRVQFEGKSTLTGVFEDKVKRSNVCPKPLRETRKESSITCSPGVNLLAAE